MNGITELSKFLGAENEEILKKGIVEIILNRVKDDLDDSATYICVPDEIEGMVDECVEECRNEVKEIIKQKLMEETIKRFESMK